MFKWLFQLLFFGFKKKPESDKTLKNAEKLSTGVKLERIKRCLKK